MCARKLRPRAVFSRPLWAARQHGLQGVPFPCHSTWSSARSPCSWQRPADPSRRSPPCVRPSLFLLPLSSTSTLGVKPIASPLQLLRVDPELQTAGLWASWALTALPPAGRGARCHSYWSSLPTCLGTAAQAQNSGATGPAARTHWTAQTGPPQIRRLLHRVIFESDLLQIPSIGDSLGLKKCFPFSFSFFFPSLFFFLFLFQSLFILWCRADIS